MITQRVESLMNLTMTTSIEQVQLQACQILDMKFTDMAEVNRFVAAKVIVKADGRDLRLAGIPDAPPPVVPPVQDPDAPKDPITASEDDVQDDEEGDAQPAEETAIDADATEIIEDAETSGSNIEDATNPVADPDEIPDAPDPVESKGSVGSKICPGCGNNKRKNKPFCAPCSKNQQ